MDNLEQKNKCQRCKYYFKRYIIWDDKLYEVYGGCASRDATLKKCNDPHAYQKKCTSWEEAESTPEQRTQSIKEEIKQINDRLAQILLILTVDDTLSGKSAKILFKNQRTLV